MQFNHAKEIAQELANGSKKAVVVIENGGEFDVVTKATYEDQMESRGVKAVEIVRPR